MGTGDSEFVVEYTDDYTIKCFIENDCFIENKAG